MFYIVRTNEYDYDGSVAWEWFFQDRNLADAFAEDLKKHVKASVWVEERSFQTSTKLTRKEVELLEQFDV